MDSDRSYLHGHHLTDLFENGQTGLATIRAYFAGLVSALNLLEFKSFVLSNYFNEVFLHRTKSRFRMMLKFAFYIILIIRLETILRLPSFDTLGPKRAFVGLIPIIIPYIFTIRSLTHDKYVMMSFVLCLSLILICITYRPMVVRQDHGLYSPGIVLLISMFVLLPIRLAVCSSMAVMFVTISIGLEILHYSIPDRRPQQPNNMTQETDVYVLIERVNQTGHYWSLENVWVSHFMAWAPVCFVGLYLRFWNLVQQRFAFFKLGKSVEAREECKVALEQQVHWIEAIMPSSVRSEYQALRQKHKYSTANMWVFNKVFNDVTILFADIVGFTNMSSNKTANQVVSMLNNLFNRFDDLCKLTQCEKIGTLGDCYYCVSGCPIPRSDHVQCCVEMGLGMCRIIKVFNCDFSESVNMRVGVHTGRVNAAIIGSQRFRFDVYSYDVIIAGALESSGRPGRVHVSQQVFDVLKHMYNFSVGEKLAVKQEEVCGIAGLKLTTTYINTYFVDPRSSMLRKKHEKFGIDQGDVKKSDSRPSTRLSFVSREAETPHQDADPSQLESDKDVFVDWNQLGAVEVEESESLIREFNRDLKMIQNLQQDPEKQYRLFRSPPLWPPLLTFYDPETEWHFVSHLKDYTGPVYVDSPKVAPIADVIACQIMFVLMQINCRICESRKHFTSQTLVFFLMTSVLSALISFCLVFPACTYDSFIQSQVWKRVYRILVRNWVRELLMSALTLMPTFMLFNLMRWTLDVRDVIIIRSTLSAMAFHCILIHCIPISSAAFIRLINALITFAVIVHTQFQIQAVDPQIHDCTIVVHFIFGVPYQRFRVILLTEMVICVGLVITITRENERNTRLCFYVSREAEIAGDEAAKAVDEAKTLLYNIIPKYVWTDLKMWAKPKASSRPITYAVTVHEAAVAFATISNFFSNYYREDYKGGENALKLLNTIVCKFDEILDHEEMKDVEKIKTINDCYMLASGLNPEAVQFNLSKAGHLVALMNCCHLMIDRLDEFNDMYIIGTDKFEIKIGYNIGPLTAGVIGITKPLYDIWGDTVNVASRMYSTGVAGRVQVPQIVVDKLDGLFEFDYRAEVFVKGKGMMSTYLCSRLDESRRARGSDFPTVKDKERHEKPNDGYEDHQARAEDQ